LYGVSFRSQRQFTAEARGRKGMQRKTNKHCIC
jgi:hypothetical protein